MSPINRMLAVLSFTVIRGAYFQVMPFRVRTRAATPERPGDDRSAESSGGPTEDRTLGEVDASPASDEEQRQGRDAAHETSELELTPAAPKPPPVVVPRWVQLVLLPLALLGVWALARASLGKYSSTKMYTAAKKNA